MNPENVQPQASPQVQPQQVVQPQTASNNKEDSDKKPIIIIFIVILLLGIIIFYYFMVKGENSKSKTTSSESQQNTQPVATSMPTPTIVNSDSSDTQLDKDIESINNKVGNLTTDVNNVDQGLNDKPLDTGL